MMPNLNTATADPALNTCAPDAEAARLAHADAVSAEHFAALRAGQLGYLDEAARSRVAGAWARAHAAHRGQWRSSGDPYITHPIAVAGICAQWGLDDQALSAALLHDAMEDCGVTREQLTQEFGPVVAAMVDGLTKLDKLQFNTREEGQAQSLRKMLLAAAEDVRVILVKLADRTHNMRTMGDMPRSKWGRIARETLEIYAPMAHRLGLHGCYRELQELSLRYLRPWRYAIVEKAIVREGTARQASRTRLLAQMRQAVDVAIAGAQVSVRPRSVFAIMDRMRSARTSFAKVTDSHGFEVIVPTLLDCYTALGALHQSFKPVPGRLKDYIANPKPNGYQSLHTTLLTATGQSLHVQLRTRAMQAAAMAGITAQMALSQPAPKVPQAPEVATSAQTPSTPKADLGRGLKQGSPLKLDDGLVSLLDADAVSVDAAEFWGNVKGDLRSDNVYVLTPHSRSIALPRGATVLDFAYAVHTDLGHRAVSAIVNGAVAALHQRLSSGDVVHIRTDDNAQPQPEWLEFAQTGRARSRIRSHLKASAEQRAAGAGQRLLAHALRAEGFANVPDPAQAEGAAIWAAAIAQMRHQRAASGAGALNSAEQVWAAIGTGATFAGWVARLLAEQMRVRGARPDPVLISQGRFAAVSADGVQASDEAGVGTAAAFVLDEAAHASVHWAQCCRPVHGDPIGGYLAHGEGLHIHHARCAQLAQCASRDAERLVRVAWGEKIEEKAAENLKNKTAFDPNILNTQPEQNQNMIFYEAAVLVTLNNIKGALAQVTRVLNILDVDIRRLEMSENAISHQFGDLKFILAVKDLAHLENIIEHLNRLGEVHNAQRILPLARG